MCDLELPSWSLFGLLDVLMQYHDPTIDDGAIEHPGDAFLRLEPELEQPVTHRPCVRHAQVRPVNFHAFRITQEPGDKTGRKAKYLLLKGGTVKGDMPGHAMTIAYPLYAGTTGNEV